ncbi:hypothetical protein EOA78_00815 [Mesorhizobium sp. M5C.F.Cr.IN.023.01.1.1]|nr:hypothetical protein EOA78_00815 [Mesorhizobium sp. M5C.F.Cr.IN.023.01.1.1]
MSFDIDALDIAYVQGAQSPGAGGNSACVTYEVILRGLRGIDVVGADVVELFAAAGSERPDRHLDP